MKAVATREVKTTSETSFEFDKELVLKSSKYGTTYKFLMVVDGDKLHTLMVVNYGSDNTSVFSHPNKELDSVNDELNTFMSMTSGMSVERISKDEFVESYREAMSSHLNVEGL